MKGNLITSCRQVFFSNLLVGATYSYKLNCNDVLRIYNERCLQQPQKMCKRKEKMRVSWLYKIVKNGVGGFY